MTLLGGDFLSRVADGLDPQPDPWMHDAKGWIRVKLGEHTWSKQDEVLHSIAENKYTAVRSAHSTGKSHIAARAIAHWVDTHPIDETFIVSTAPSAPQVKAILWRYLKQIHVKGNLPGYITESEVPEWKIGTKLIGWGRKPADLVNAQDAATAFQGVHARYLLVVLDEAGGIPEWLWTAVNSIATQPTNRVLAIGNPDDPTSHFAKICQPDSKWHKIKISAFDAPAFTGERVTQEILDNLIGPETVREWADEWGEDSPTYIAKVLAEFPENNEDRLIPIAWINAAIQRDFSGEAVADLGKYAMDVGRTGKDESTLGFSRAGMFRIVKAARGIGNTMKLVGWMSAEHRRRPAVPFMIDADGIGGPVYDRAMELRLPASAFYAQRKARNPRKFINRRSEQWWMVRDLFKDGLWDIDPADKTLQAQLASIRYEEDSSGRIIVESKKDMRKRGMPSPDRADTLMMLTAPYDDWTEAWDPDDVYDPEHVGGDGSITSDLLVREM